MILSILICSLYERAGMLAGLLRELNKQIEELHAQDKVEIIVELDGRELTTGEKRNRLYQAAKGTYTISIDDDDIPAPYYVKELLIAAKSDTDCFAQNGYITTDGRNSRKWYISIHNPYETKIIDGQTVYFRYPNHITAIRSSLAKQVKFPHIVHGEDYEWATELKNRGLLKTEFVIQKPIYHYDYKTQK